MRSLTMCTLQQTVPGRWDGNVACMGQNKNAYKVLGRKSEGKIPFLAPSCRRIILKRIFYKVLAWSTEFIWLKI
jgi:hypothetical protein